MGEKGAGMCLVPGRGGGNEVRVLRLMGTRIVGVITLQGI